MRYFIGFLISIGLIVLLIVLIFSGGGGNKTKVPATAKTLASYSTSDAQVRMTIDGPINANQIHQQIRITVDQNQVRYEQLKGYDGNVTDSKTFQNTQSAYDNFLHALTVAGFTQGDTNPTLSNERGYCPIGDRYIFELIQSGRDIQRYWATSCGKPKTYLGSRQLTSTLFEAQVPGFNNLTANLDNIAL